MSDNGNLRRAFEAATLVTEFALVIVVTLYLGYRLDIWLGTEPWLFLLGTLLGFVAGLIRLFQGLGKLQDDDDHPEDHPS
ncbi:MAG: AtpZ/AtpI family protein [Deltaproteobacteria bacterium]|nr:AtpZ/AtpI family protein [Deltaproteobacteria bacterium]